jgi:hypothetical protein
VSVSGSIVRVPNKVDGAVHVTACHKTSLWCHSQQLRLHESTHLQCHSTVSAGAILEDCNRIVFFVGGDKSALDVKDFNWLKRGVPSPNYSIEEEDGNNKEEGDAVLPSQHTQPQGVGRNNETNRSGTSASAVTERHEEEKDGDQGYDDNDDEL